MKIVAVSTCTAGIAHTYMSQEALEQECEKRNWVQALISIFYYQLLMKSKRTSPHCMWKRKSQFRIIGVSSKRKFWELS